MINKIPLDWRDAHYKQQDENTMKKAIQTVINEAVTIVQQNTHGRVADYIPELASTPEDIVAVAVRLLDGVIHVAGNDPTLQATLQSVAKLVVLIGLLEEMGADKVFSWLRVEPSGDDFNSIARLDQFGPLPSNPMLNAGAITLCSRIPGNAEQQHAWLETWIQRLFGENLYIDPKVLASEKRTGDRNRSLAYLLKNNHVINGNVEAILDTYFCLCSFRANPQQVSYLPMLLARNGLDLNGKRIISHQTVKQVLAIMATCGLYNESGAHLVRTGMPAKSGVSGFILAVAMRQAGIVVFSPRVNDAGTSIRGELILEYLSKQLAWHFAD